jgi:hypothetical protein
LSSGQIWANLSPCGRSLDCRSRPLKRSECSDRTL